MKKETIAICSVFLFGSVWGYCFEVLLMFSRGRGFVNRGYLFGPYLPVYGFGLLLCWFFSKMIKRVEPLKCCLIVRILIEFVAFFILATILEYITGSIMEWIFHRRWWDYTGYFMNIDGRVCLESSLVFTFVSMFLVKVIVPFLEKATERIRSWKQKSVFVILLTIMFIDFIISTTIHFMNIK